MNPLQQCERERNQNTTADKKADGFLKLQMDTCSLENCSCVAYSYDAGIGHWLYVLDWKFR
jgi:hypothetical protein